MSKTVKIPKCMNPFEVTINGQHYSYPAGTEQDVPDEVAAVIENHEKAHEALTKPKEYWAEVIEKGGGEERREIPETSSEGGSITDLEFAKLLIENAQTTKFYDLYNGKEMGTDYDRTINTNANGVSIGFASGWYCSANADTGVISISYGMGGGGAIVSIKKPDKVAYHPVLDKPYVTFFVSEEDRYVYIDEDRTIKATRDYIIEALKAGKTTFLKLDDGTEMIAYSYDAVDHMFCDNLYGSWGTAEAPDQT